MGERDIVIGYILYTIQCIAYILEVKRVSSIDINSGSGMN